MKGSPCRLTVMYAAATLVELALPSTLTAGSVGRARDDKRNKIWQQIYKHGIVLIDDVMQRIHRFGPLTRKASAGLGCLFIPSG